MTEQQIMIIGAPDRGQGLDGYAKGTRSITCEDCGGATYFAPSSLNRPEAAGARFICTECAKKHDVSKAETGPLTDEQRREFVERGIDPDAVQQMLDTHGPEGLMDLAALDQKIDQACRRNRPNDAELEALANTWRLGIARRGPEANIPLPATAILTLVVELIELRAKVKGST